MSEPLRFELDRLPSYDDDSLIAELQRVAALVDAPTLTRAAFDAHARVDSSTVLRRLGGWHAALARAGLGDRYSGRTVSPAMREQRARTLTDDELVEELRRVADALGSRSVTIDQFRTHSEGISDASLVRRFGSWGKALTLAGLELSALGRRWSEDDYFENLLAVWTHYGRPPRYSEMNLPPSRITNGAYAAKWGTWTKAKKAFVERVNADLAKEAPAEPRQPQPAQRARRSPQRPEVRRSIPLGLRYDVLRRDRFRCSTCGASPATDLGCVLHVDHVAPVAAGGKTTAQNLRALCAQCNVGKGAKLDSP